MEGDAGASRLNPNEIDDSSSSEVTAEDSAESEVGAHREITEVTAEDSAESEEAADREITESSAEELSDSASVENATETANDERGSSRLGRGWLIGITAALLVLAGGVGTGGYFALRSNQESQAIARHDAEAVAAAKDCVAATQAFRAGMPTPRIICAARSVTPRDRSVPRLFLRGHPVRHGAPEPRAPPCVRAARHWRDNPVSVYTGEYPIPATQPSHSLTAVTPR